MSCLGRTNRRLLACNLPAPAIYHQTLQTAIGSSSILLHCLSLGSRRGTQSLDLCRIMRHCTVIVSCHVLLHIAEGQVHRLQPQDIIVASTTPSYLPSEQWFPTLLNPYSLPTALWTRQYVVQPQTVSSYKYNRRSYFGLTTCCMGHGLHD